MGEGEGLTVSGVRMGECGVVLDERPPGDSRAVGFGSSVRFLLAAMISAGDINGGGTVVDADRAGLLNAEGAEARIR